MTNDEQAFIRAIIASPDDDLPRLVYADWLEENAGSVPCERCGVSGSWAGTGLGGCIPCDGTGYVSDGRKERAEFIRVQCELAGMGPTCAGIYDDVFEGWTSRRNELLEAERVLKKPLIEEWKAKYGYEKYPTWSRGFVSEVRLSLRDFFGGECDGCQESGQANDAIGRLIPCGACHGTGRTESLGRRIAAEQPCKVWRISDRSPFGPGNDEDDHVEGNDIGWQRSSFREEHEFADGYSWCLPDELFDLLPGTLWERNQSKYYPSREAALDALSEAAWLWANKPRIEASIEWKESEIKGLGIEINGNIGIGIYLLNGARVLSLRELKSSVVDVKSLTKKEVTERLWKAYCRKRAEVNTSYPCSSPADPEPATD